MYPHAVPSEQHRETGAANAYTVIGFLFFLAACLRLLSTRRLSEALTTALAAAAFWIQAVLTKAGVGKRMRMLVAAVTVLLLIWLR